MYEKEEKMCDVMWKNKSLRKNCSSYERSASASLSLCFMFYDEQEKRSFDDDDN